MSNHSEISTASDFTPSPVGTIFNPLPREISGVTRVKDEITIRYPSRLDAMSTDPSRLTKNANSVYTSGQIDFAIKVFRTVNVKSTGTKGEISITPSTERHVLINHAVALMRAALHVDDGYQIDVKEDVRLRHCGLGSSSALITSVACAINELYGNPITDKEMVKYAAQNHGEEIDDNPDMINPVQSMGGSAASGTYQGGLIIIGGENVVIKTMYIPDKYDVVIGVPRDFEPSDSKTLMDMEIQNLHKFYRTGMRYRNVIAYRLLHECFPAIEEGDLKPIGDLIFDYRYKMGSIRNCSFVYPPLVKLANSVAFLKEEGVADVLSVSSVGPGIFAITENADYCREVFEGRNMNTMVTKIHNGRYEIASES